MQKDKRVGMPLAAVAAAGLLAAALAARAGEIRPDGLFITVPNPITENAVLQIKQHVKDAVERQGRTISVVVFDFNPRGKPAGTGNVFPCMDLKNYISELSLGQIIKPKGVLTVAYIQDEVTDHSVLPVLACREIVMSSKGSLGHVVRSQEKAFPKESESYQAYRDAYQVKSKPEVLRKLLEPSKGLSMFDHEEAQKVGLCIPQRVETRPDLRQYYDLPALSLREDYLAGRTPIVWRIEIHGALDTGKLNSLERRIKAAIGKNANTIILHLDCDGGETRDAAARAERLRNLTDEGGVLPVKTIAYVPSGRSLGAATFLAVGCSEIAMAPDARLGGF